MDSLTSFINQSKEEGYKIIKDLCSIPAPTRFEQGRAEYCKNWLIGIGAEGVYIDEAKNVIFPINCENSSDITVFAAHTDTVFPDTEPMPYFDDGERIHSPGVADDTASVAVLLRRNILWKIRFRRTAVLCSYVTPARRGSET